MATAYDPELLAVNAWEPEQPAEERITLEELVDALKREADAANSEWDRTRGFVRLAWDYYDAKPFGNEDPSRSQIVLPDVQETVDYMVPSVLRTFVSGDRVVEFEATDEADEAAADEATAAISYSFMRDQDGYGVLHNWLTCGMVERYAITKAMVSDEERIRRERVTISDPVELEGFDGEVEDATQNPDGTYTLSLKAQERRKRFLAVSVPINEFRYSARARHEDEADYLAHCPLKTRSELVDMGFDRDQVYGLPTYSRLPDGTEDDRYDPDPESTKALQQVQLWEEYARIDIDGDGIAERVKVFRVDNEILRWQDGELAIETVDEQPFSIFTPFPRPHRIDGYSLADKVMDIQLSRSTWARQMYDGMFASNNPRTILGERGMNENTIDDLLSSIGPIRVNDPSQIVPFVTTFDPGKSLSVMEWLTGERESRTGITRLNQGLDADTLNKTATGTALMQSQGQQQEEYIARNFAESLSRLFAKLYRLRRREGEPFKIKVDGKYKMVDPSAWPEDVNVTIRVGLGTGSKDKRVQARMMLAPLLAEGAMTGKVSDKHLFHAMDGLVRDLGIGQGDDFWIDPSAPPDPNEQQQQEQPDPELVKVQAEQQREDAKFQAEQQRAAAQLQMQRDKDAAAIEAQREKHAMDMAQAREKAALEAQLARDKATTEAEIAIYQIDRQAEVATYAARMKQSSDETISKNRDGGNLDQ